MERGQGTNRLDFDCYPDSYPGCLDLDSEFVYCPTRLISLYVEDFSDVSNVDYFRLFCLIKIIKQQHFKLVRFKPA